MHEWPDWRSGSIFLDTLMSSRCSFDPRFWAVILAAFMMLGGCGEHREAERTSASNRWRPVPSDGALGSIIIEPNGVALPLSVTEEDLSESCVSLGAGQSCFDPSLLVTFPYVEVLHVTSDHTVVIAAGQVADAQVIGLGSILDISAQSRVATYLVIDDFSFGERLELSFADEEPVSCEWEQEGMLCNRA
jgi:hypothetical protein